MDLADKKSAESMSQPFFSNSITYSPSPTNSKTLASCILVDTPCTNQIAIPFPVRCLMIPFENASSTCSIEGTVLMLYGSILKMGGSGFQMGSIKENCSGVGTVCLVLIKDSSDVS